MNDLIAFYDERQARYLERMVRRLKYGDALVQIIPGESIARRVKRCIASTKHKGVLYQEQGRYTDALFPPAKDMPTGWRLEYINPDEGEPHYRLYHGKVTMGIQYVRAATWLAQVQRKLGGHLLIVGFRPENTTFVSGGAKTAIDAEHNREQKLFGTRFDKKWVERCRQQGRNDVLSVRQRTKLKRIVAANKRTAPAIMKVAETI